MGGEGHPFRKLKGQFCFLPPSLYLFFLFLIPVGFFQAFYMRMNEANPQEEGSTLQQVPKAFDPIIY